MSSKSINVLEVELVSLQKKHREEEKVKAAEHRKKEKVLISKIEVLKIDVRKKYSDKTNEFLNGKITKEELEAFARENNLIKLEGEK